MKQISVENDPDRRFWGMRWHFKNVLDRFGQGLRDGVIMLTLYELTIFVGCSVQWCTMPCSRCLSRWVKFRMIHVILKLTTQGLHRVWATTLQLWVFNYFKCQLVIKRSHSQFDESNCYSKQPCSANFCLFHKKLGLQQGWPYRSISLRMSNRVMHSTMKKMKMAMVGQFLVLSWRPAGGAVVFWTSVII